MPLVFMDTQTCRKDLTMPRDPGSGKRYDTGPQIASKIVRAERSKCPKCGRKSALTTFSDDWGAGYGITVTYCRWNDTGKCDYTVKKVWEPVVAEQTPTDATQTKG